MKINPEYHDKFLMEEINSFLKSPEKLNIDTKRYLNERINGIIASALANNAGEQLDEEGIGVADILRRKDEKDIPFYLSFVWYPELNPFNEAQEKARKQLFQCGWPEDNFHIQTENMHLTMASLGRIGDNYEDACKKLKEIESSTKLKDKVQRVRELWLSFDMKFTSATIGKTGIYLQTEAYDGRSQYHYKKNMKSLRYNFPKADTHDIGKLSVSIARFLNPLDEIAHDDLISYFYSLLTMESIIVEATISIERIDLALLDKVGRKLKRIEDVL